MVSVGRKKSEKFVRKRIMKINFLVAPLLSHKYS